MKKALIVRFAISLLLMAATLFLPTGTLRYWQGWAYFVATGIANALLVLYLGRHDPKLLERRVRGRETTAWRQTFQAALMLFWFGTVAVASFDHRFGWSRDLPVWLQVFALIVVVASYGLQIEVFRANTFAAHTIRVEAEQKVVSTGPYRWVRHPMYTGLSLLAIFTSLALGSWWGLIPAAMMIASLVFRLVDEEKLLRRELAGYAEYCARTRWRLAPGVF